MMEPCTCSHGNQTHLQLCSLQMPLKHKDASFVESVEILEIRSQNTRAKEFRDGDFGSSGVMGTLLTSPSENLEQSLQDRLPLSLLSPSMLLNYCRALDKTHETEPTQTAICFYCQK